MTVDKIYSTISLLSEFLSHYAKKKINIQNFLAPSQLIPAQSGNPGWSGGSTDHGGSVGPNGSGESGHQTLVGLVALVGLVDLVSLVTRLWWI